MARKKHSHLKHYLIPHKGNKYRPQLFAYSTITAIVAGLIILEGGYFFATAVVWKHTNFLASVLPGALISLTNSDRASQNLNALIEDPLLDEAAQLKADDMAAKGYFAHVTPEGYQPWHWFDAVGYKYTYAGENLAVNFTDSTDVETAWMNSPTHRANLLKPQYTRVGLATADGMYQGKEVTFVVQEFAATPTSAAPAPKPVYAPTPEPAKSGAGTIATTKPAATGPLATVQTDTGPTRVLGAETEPPAPASSAVGFFSQVATSPTHTLIYILTGLAGIVAVILLIALVVHMSIASVEVIGAGFALLMIVLGFLVVDAGRIGTVEVPADTQSASVIEAF